jgi:Lrp/AsnC family transcriptional regulator for asnA, asnC and gidA
MQDGRMSAADIARQVGAITDRTVRYRIDRMISAGVLRISSVVNPKALGFSVVADVFVEVEPACIDEVARRLVEHEQVTYVACSIGERDLSVQVVARSNEEIYAFATKVIGKLPGVRKTKTSIVPIVIKDVYQWRVPHSSTPEAGSEQKTP